MQRLTEGGFDPDQPVSVLQRHPHVTLVADRGALTRVNEVSRISGYHAGFYILEGSENRTDKYGTQYAADPAGLDERKHRS